MAPASVNTMARNSQILQAIEPPKPARRQIEAPSAFDLREFVSDEDAVNFNSALWDSIDQTAFVLAQRQALEEFNVAKAIRLSEETAAVESKQRSATAASVAVASVSPETQASSTSSSSVGPSSAIQSQPIAIRKSQRSASSAPAPPSDEAAAISLARSWRGDSVQPTVSLENNISVSSSPKTHQKSSSVSASSSSYQPSHHHHHHERKTSSSIVKQPSKNLSLSTSSSPLDSRFVSASDSVPLQAHSRASQSNAIQSSSSTAQSHHIEQRTLSKREPERSISMSPPSSSSSQAQASDVTNTKRRRTEHQPSTSTSSHNNTLVAPSISHSKKSTASARDVRLGQMINPISEIAVSQVAPSMEKRSKSRHRSAHKSSDTDLFTAARNCAKCGTLVDSPRSQPSFAHDPFALPFSGLLHVACSACRTTHCRGCFAIVRCPPDCTGNATCTVRNCCPDVRAIAIFEALSSFDHMYAVEAGFAGKSGSQNQNHRDRLTYTRRIISRADQSSRFESAFVCTLRILCTWLQPSETEKEMGEMGRLHPSVPKLLASSFLPEVVHAFLSNTNVRDWIPHSVTYSAILDTLRCMFDCGLKGLMMRPLFHIAQSPGLQALVWAQGSIVWELDAANGNRPIESPSLCDLVKQLEVYRVPLMNLADKVSFKATVEKVNNLCDGISYLLLQQVVGGL